MENPNNKCCMVEGHKEVNIAQICVDVECKHPSRVLCSQCLQEQENNHKKCSDFLGFKSKNSSELKLKKTKKSYDIHRFLDNINNFEKESCLKIEELYTTLLENIIEKIQKQKKYFKLNILNTYNEVKQEMEKEIQNQDHFLDFSFVQREINRFKEGDINHKRLNQIFTEKQQQNTNNMNLINRYKQIRKPQFRQNSMDFIQSWIYKVLDSYYILDVDLLQYKQITPKFYPERNGIREQQQENIYQFNQNIDLFGAYEFIPFQKAKLQFKVILNPNSPKYFSIIFYLKGDDFRDPRWRDRPQQFILSNSGFRFGYLKKVPFEDSFQPEQIFTVFFNDLNNIFRIESQDQKFIYEKYQKLELDQQIDESDESDEEIWDLEIKATNNVIIEIL